MSKRYLAAIFVAAAMGYAGAPEAQERVDAAGGATASADPAAAEPAAVEIEAERDTETRVDGDDQAVDALLQALEREEALDLPEAAAGFGAGGGGEVFGMIQVVSWILHQIDFAAEAYAQESPLPVPGSATDPDGSPLLQQALARIRIAREVLIHQVATDYLGAQSILYEQIERRVVAGVSGKVDLNQAAAAHLQAQLEQKEAAFSRDLAIDRYEDIAGERPSTASFPNWNYTPAATIEDAKRRVPEALQTSARRYWRQLRFADESLALLEDLLDHIDSWIEACERQFSIGQRSLADIQQVLQTGFEVRVRQAERRFDLKTAEAWFLAAEGGLKPGVFEHSTEVESSTGVWRPISTSLSPANQPSTNGDW